MSTSNTTPSLFPEMEMEAAKPQPRRPSGGSQNPIVFNDYESFIKKFEGPEMTTDDCYTPQDIYEAVVQYVHEMCPETVGMQILRPFYPGGDYENAEYPEDGVVIDNPPFSIFSQIVQWYMARNVPFFLFGPGLTIMGACKYGATAVIVDCALKFHNKAAPKINFVSNLFGDVVAMTAPRLKELLEACPSQDVRVNLPKYEYPEELCSVSDLQSMCRGGEDFRIMRGECMVVRNLDNHPKGGGLFGDHLLLAKAKAKAKAKAIELALKGRTNKVPLSPRERRLVASIGKET